MTKACLDRRRWHLSAVLLTLILLLAFPSFLSCRLSLQYNSNLAPSVRSRLLQQLTVLHGPVRAARYVVLQVTAISTFCFDPILDDPAAVVEKLCGGGGGSDVVDEELAGLCRTRRQELVEAAGEAVDDKFCGPGTSIAAIIEKLNAYLQSLDPALNPSSSSYVSTSYLSQADSVSHAAHTSTLAEIRSILSSGLDPSTVYAMPAPSSPDSPSPSQLYYYRPILRHARSSCNYYPSSLPSDLADIGACPLSVLERVPNSPFLVLPPDLVPPPPPPDSLLPSSPPLSPSADDWRKAGASLISAGWCDHGVACFLRALGLHVAATGSGPLDDGRDDEAGDGRTRGDDLLGSMLSELSFAFVGDPELYTDLLLSAIGFTVGNCARSPSSDMTSAFSVPLSLGAPSTRFAPLFAGAASPGLLRRQEGGGDRGERLTAFVLKIVTLIPSVIQGGVQEIEAFRNSYLEDVTTLTTKLEQSFKSVEQYARDNYVDPSQLFPAKIDSMLAAIGVTPFHLSHQGGNDIQHMRAIQSLYGLVGSNLRTIPAPRPTRATGTASTFSPGSPGGGGKDGRIRIAFVSSLLKDHSIGRMMATLMISLSEEAPFSSLFEVIAVGPGYPNYSTRLFTHLEGDPVARTLAQLTSSNDDVVIRYTGRSISESATLPSNLPDCHSLLAALQPDIILYPDVGMEGLTFFLSHARIAPLQLVWWGHPSTVGGNDTIDYFLGLEVENEDAGQGEYVEQLVRMKLINTAPFSDAPNGPEVTDPIEYFGINHVRGANGCETDLPNVYLILGRLFKLHPDFENAMFEILNRDKCGRIVLITERARHLNQVVYGRLRSTALSKGYEEELTRIHFVAYWNYVRVLAHGTIVLDTFPYGGCLTAQEGMSNGKIVVTLPGSYVRGRFTKMIYEQMGGGKNEQGWAPIASTTEEFVEMAVKLGTDVTIRQSVKSAINSEWSTVGKDAEVAAEWSEFFVRAWLGIQTK